MHLSARSPLGTSSVGECMPSLATALPLPDELARSYLGSIVRINGFRKPEDLEAYLDGVAPANRLRGRSPSQLERLSNVTGIDLPDFVRQHTMLPLRRAITGHHSALEHGSKSRPTLTLWAMQALREGIYLCPDCVVEDTEFHGRSYWRREHQIPGVFWCLKHLCALRFCRDEAALLAAPSTQLGTSITPDRKWVAGLLREGAVRRYVEICSAFLDTSKPFDAREVRRVLQRRSNLLGYRSLHAVAVGSRARPSLAEGVRRLFPIHWLQWVMPALTQATEDGAARLVDSAVWQAGSASCITYALVCSTLFESADEALGALSESKLTVSGGRATSREPDFDSAQLMALYVGNDGNFNRISVATGLKYRRIAAGMLKAGLPSLRTAHGKNLSTAVRNFLLGGASLSDACREAGVELDSVESLLRHASCHLATALRSIDRTIGSPSRRQPSEALSSTEVAAMATR